MNLNNNNIINSSVASDQLIHIDNEPVIVNPSERHFVDYLADMYAAVLCLERLERAHNRDLVHTEEYNKVLEKTLNRIKNIENQLNVAASSGLRYSGLDDFLQTYGVAQACGAARARLIENARLEAERNAAREKQQSEAEKQKNAPVGPNPTSVLQAAQHFITLMDCLKLNQRSTDQLYPLILDLLNAVKRVHPQFDQLPRLTNWVTLLDSMKASDELNDEQMREFLFDVERGYNGFYRYLDGIQHGGASNTNNNNLPSSSGSPVVLFTPR
jgi:ESCRT-I complex subunit VPS28